MQFHTVMTQIVEILLDVMYVASESLWCCPKTDMRSFKLSVKLLSAIINHISQDQHLQTYIFQNCGYVKPMGTLAPAVTQRLESLDEPHPGQSYPWALRQTDANTQKRMWDKNSNC